MIFISNLQRYLEPFQTSEIFEQQDANYTSIFYTSVTFGKFLEKPVVPA